MPVTNVSIALRKSMNPAGVTKIILAALFPLIRVIGNSIYLSFQVIAYSEIMLLYINLLNFICKFLC